MPTSALPSPTPATLVELPLGRLRPAPDNLRRRARTGPAFNALVASVRTAGILQPLIVTPPEADGTHRIIAGHRRYEAAKDAGLPAVPCLVRTPTDAERVEAMLIENDHREDLSPLARASGYFRLIEHGQTLEGVARKLGRSKRHVTEHLALLDLPKEAQEAVHAGKFPVSAAGQLARLREHPDALARLLAHPPTDWKAAVDRALGEARAAAEVARLTAQARAAGHAVLEFAWHIPGNSKATPIGREPGDVAVDLTAHRAEPCHAVAVLTGRPPRAVEVCTEPARHEPGGSSRLTTAQPSRWATRRAEQVAKRAATKARRQAARARRAFIQEVTGQRLPDRESRTLVNLAYLRGMSHHEAEELGALLGLTPLTAPWGGKDWQAAVHAFIAASDANVELAARALMLLHADRAWEQTWNEPYGFRDRAKRFLRTLGFSAPEHGAAESQAVVMPPASAEPGTGGEPPGGPDRGPQASGSSTPPT